MPSALVVQDSDDELGLSPEKLPQLEVRPNDSFFDSLEDKPKVAHNVNKVEAPHTASNGN